MSHDPSRKKFFARLLGLLAVSSVMPKLFAKPVSNLTLPPSSVKNSEFKLRPAPRTVARRPESL